MNVLLAGGAGYIGSHTCVELIEAGHSVVIADNFSNSCPEAVKRVEELTNTKIPLYEADVCDKDAVEKIFAENEIVMRGGYVGAGPAYVLLALFGLLLLSGCRVAFKSSDGCGRLFAVGFTTLIFAHVYVNIAMSIGLVPITGLPLPFISSGRTFLVTVMCGLGIIQSVSIHREKAT